MSDAMDISNDALGGVSVDAVAVSSDAVGAVSDATAVSSDGVGALSDATAVRNDALGGHGELELATRPNALKRVTDALQENDGATDAGPQWRHDGRVEHAGAQGSEERAELLCH